MAAILLAVNRTHKGRVPPSANWEAYNTSFEPEPLDVCGVAEVIRQGYAIAPLHHTKRETANFQRAQHIGLDFDTEDSRSRLDTLGSDPFIGQYAAILHTTSSHKPEGPRARVLFILDQPIKDVEQYRQYVRALNWYFGCTDQQAQSAVQLFFGAVDCGMTVHPDKVLPLSVLDEIVTEYEDAHRLEPGTTNAPLTGDPVTLLDAAIRDARPGARHSDGFRFCRQLRDIGLLIEDAAELLKDYQITVEKMGDHPYTWTEAWASLRGAYTRQPSRRASDGLEEQLVRWEWAAWEKKRGLTHGATHYSLQSVMAVSGVCRKFGRITGVDLPLRDFGDYGVPRQTASNHLSAMRDAGAIRLEAKSDRVRANSYSLVLPEVSHDGTGVSHDIAITAAYRQLQGMPHFIQHARIDPRLWKGEPPAGTLGPTAQRLVAALVQASWDGGVPFSSAKVGQQKKGTLHTPPLFQSCPTLALESCNSLYDVAGVSSRSGKRSFEALVELGVCTTEVSPDNHRARIPSLTENWWERLQEIAPALTTFGRAELLAARYNTERNSYYNPTDKQVRGRKFIDKLQGERAEAAQAAGKAAADKLAAHERTIARLNEQRRAWAKSQGITGDVPPISTQGAPRPAKVQQPVAANGRVVIPKNAKTGKNQQTQRERLDILLQKQVLFEDEAAAVHHLATELGVPVEWQRTELEIARAVAP